MSGRKRKVYFFEIVEVDQQENVRGYEADGALEIHNHVKGLPEDRLRLLHQNQKIAGSARYCDITFNDYFYIGKTRNGADWPDMQRGNNDPEPLKLPSPDIGLVEPAYLLPIPGTKYLAAVRTNGGPSWSAIEKWLTAVTGSDTRGIGIELRPYVREDQFRRLHSAIGATKLHLKFDPGTAMPPGAGEIGKAVNAIQEVGARGVSVEVSLSFGNATPDDAAAAEIVSELQEIIGKVPTKSAKATLLQPSDNSASGFKKDYVDFVRDRVTEQVEIGETADELPSTHVILGSMHNAIRNFRQHNNV